MAAADVLLPLLVRSSSQQANIDQAQGHALLVIGTLQPARIVAEHNGLLQEDRHPPGVCDLG